MNDQSQPHPIDRHDGLPIPRRYWSAAGIWLALAMAVLDGAIANVALPVIAKQLGASPAASIWIINAYQLTITMLLLPLAPWATGSATSASTSPGWRSSLWARSPAPLAGRCRC